MGSSFPQKFLVATRTDGGDFKLVKSILFLRHIEGVYGELEEVKKMRNGSLLLKTRFVAQVTELLKCDHFGDIPVKVEEHKTLNQVRSVISHRDLILNTDEEFLEDMRHRNVVNVWHITRRVNNSDVATGAFIISFNLSVLPEKVKVTTYRCDVRPYYPPPMRCYNCQTFGHITIRCSNKAVCGNCGRDPHSGEECTTPPQCTNCPGLHSPRDRNCPVYLKEKKIQEIKTLEGISYQDARKRYNNMNAPTQVLDFTTVAKNLIPSTSSFLPSNSEKPNSPAIVPAQKAAAAPQSSAAKSKSPKVVLAPPSANKKAAPLKATSAAQQGRKVVARPLPRSWLRPLPRSWLRPLPRPRPPSQNGRR